ncbi:esterase family protein [Sphingobium sp. BYY-5]|uniref:alpha/beta hydrolase n=1 Tax=Sphingobium sp. BYY-5 TaxID=2926400 RepID=UPI001FA772EB|nr:alpha/beta hydrolase-fold protein [Sphingobium sp. BYY-5]MCI4591257.1 esterase family protein [Sphingobium sp. BYY-5]
MRKLLLAILLLISTLAGASAIAAPKSGRVISAQIHSAAFSESRIGISPVRKMGIYLPAGYADHARRFPVIYFLSSFFEDETAPFANHEAATLFDEAIRKKVIGDVIVVTADFTTPAGGSWFVNSPVTGNWEDFMVRELVPYIDANYRTLAQRDSRGVAGDRMGGYGAIRFGMRYPEIFGSVYALHPIGIGQGVQTMFSRPNWTLLANARSMDDLRVDGFSQIFTSIFQAHLPAPDRPPLFFARPASMTGGRLDVDAALTQRLQDSFFLDRQVGRYAKNLQRLRALKFDWARGDANPDHIVSLQAFTRTLDEYGISYEAEEYRGGWGERHWGKQGRVYSDMLPFFREYLEFQGQDPSTDR